MSCPPHIQCKGNPFSTKITFHYPFIFFWILWITTAISLWGGTRAAPVTLAIWTAYRILQPLTQKKKIQAIATKTQRLINPGWKLLQLHSRVGRPRNEIEILWCSSWAAVRGLGPRTKAPGPNRATPNSPSGDGACTRKRSGSLSARARRMFFLFFRRRDFKNCIFVLAASGRHYRKTEG